MTVFPPAYRGFPYRTTWVQHYGGRPPYVWSVSAGALPAGLALDQHGFVSGTPQPLIALGAHPFTVRLTDALGRYGEKAFSIDVQPGDDMPLPILEWSSATLINVLAHPGSVSTTVRVIFQDGLERTFTGTITFNPSAVGEGGLDAGAEAARTGYYLYLVPTAADDSLLCVRGSVRTPDLGPVGYVQFKYIGCVWNDAGSNLLGFHHEGGPSFKLETQQLAWSSGAVGPDGAPVAQLLDGNAGPPVRAFVPWTATSVLLYGDLEGPAGGTTYEWRFSMHGTGDQVVHLEVRGTSTIDTLAWDMPIHTPQTVYRQLVRTVGAANVTVADLWVLGWDDGWLPGS